MKTIRFIAIIVVSAVVAMVAAACFMAVWHYEFAGVAVFFGTAISFASVLGAFDESAKRASMRQNIRHRMGKTAKAA